MPRPPFRELFYTADEVAARLGDAEWTAQARPAQATTPDGEQVTIHFTVLKAQRAG